MISVEQLYLTVGDLLRKDHLGGYMSSDEFNRQLKITQQLMFDYYFEVEQDEQSSREVLKAFFRTKRLSSTDQKLFRLPSDFNRKLDMWIGSVDACEVGDFYVPVETPARNELSRTLSSPVRKPSVNRKYVVAEFRDGFVRIWPEISTPYTVNINYYIEPPEAIRAYTVDPNTDEEVLNEADTVDLIWPEDKLPDFIDLMLLYKGLLLRSSSLVQWVQAKKVMSEI